MAYTRLDLITSVQEDLNDSAFSTSRIARYLNHAQNLIFNTHAFKFTEDLVTDTLSIGDYYREQEADHQSTIGGSLIDPVTATRVFALTMDSEEPGITYLPSREFFARYPDPTNQTSAVPTYWTEYGSRIYFNCEVDKAYIFNQRYYRTPTAMTVDASVPDVPEVFRELLELYALHRAEKYRGNHDVAATYKQDFEDGLEAMTIRYSGNEVGFHQMQSDRVVRYYDDY